jgi:uncharacterized protein YjbI with pentapeptide repeats
MILLILVPALWKAPLGVEPNKIDMQLTPPKTYWDWIELLIIPVSLIIIASLLNESSKSNELRLQEERDAETTIQKYYDYIYTLIQAESITMEMKRIMNALSVNALRVANNQKLKNILTLHKESNIFSIDEWDYKLENCLFQNRMIDNIDLSNVWLKGGQAIKCLFDNVNFSLSLINEFEFTDSKFGDTSFFHSKIHNTYYKNSRFIENDFSGASFTGCCFEKSNINSSVVHNTEFIGCLFEKTKLSGLNFCETQMIETRFQNCDLRGCNFDNYDLKFLEIDNKTLLSYKWNYVRSIYEGKRLPFIPSNLCNANFNYSDLSKMVYIRTKFKKSTFEKANLSDSVFYKCDFTEADLTRADLKNADFSGCVFTNTNLTDIELNNGTVLPDDIRQKVSLVSGIQSGRIYTKQIFEDIVIGNKNIHDSNFSEASFQNCRILNCTFDNCNFQNVKVNDTQISGCRIKDCDLTGSEFGPFDLFHYLNEISGIIKTDGTKWKTGDEYVQLYDWLSPRGQIEGMFPAHFGHAIGNWLSKNGSEIGFNRNDEYPMFTKFLWYDDTDFEEYLELYKRFIYEPRKENDLEIKDFLFIGLITHPYIPSSEDDIKKSKDRLRCYLTAHNFPKDVRIILCGFNDMDDLEFYGVVSKK